MKKARTHTIKLFKTAQINGVTSLQSQLYIGKATADFILDSNGVLKCWGKGDKGFDFYEYKGKYSIVENIKEMTTQPLH